MSRETLAECVSPDLPLYMRLRRSRSVPDLAQRRSATGHHAGTTRLSRTARR
ncbi:hypothetical protein Pd630_LPD07525 [Rhodococcus opacus PD630]|nr:hypothetical protein Pd630_LPD07525 [Rhodococcus opacus PD630]